MIERAHPLPVTGQARLLGLARSRVSYRPVATSEVDLKLMAAIDLVHTEPPFYGARGSAASFSTAASWSATATWPP